MDSNNQRTTTYVSVSIQHDKIGVHMCRLTNIKLSGNTLHAIHVVSHAQDRDDLSSYYFFSARRLFINRVPNYWRIFCGTNTFNVWLSVPDLRLRTSTSFVFLCAIVLLYCFFSYFPPLQPKKASLTFLFFRICLDFQKPLFKRDVTSLEDLHPGTRLSGRVTNMTSFGAFVDCGVGRDGLVHNSSMGRFKGKVGLGDLVEVTVKNVDIQKQHVGLILKDISSRFDPQLLVSIGNLSQSCAR